MLRSNVVESERMVVVFLSKRMSEIIRRARETLRKFCTSPDCEGCGMKKIKNMNDSKNSMTFIGDLKNWGTLG